MAEEEEKKMVKPRIKDVRNGSIKSSLVTSTVLIALSLLFKEFANLRLILIKISMTIIMKSSLETIIIMPHYTQ
ncbi:MAG: hypothetical protein ACI9OS_002319 [Ulvibacter sp.]|jgi:hypothetical protein